MTARTREGAWRPWTAARQIWVCGPLGLALVGALGVAAPRPAAAQKIVFSSDLPRTLVFIAEKGEGQVATRDFVAFLRQAGFPLVDPALAHAAAQRELVRQALGGDEGAAVALGRDFGAQVLILGRSDWGARPDPVDRSAMTATAEVEVRALRLDNGKVMATGRGQGRKLEATEEAARTGAVRQAATQVLRATAFLGQIVNGWTAEPWSAAGYFPADPGSTAQAVEQSKAAPDALRLAILNTQVAPAAGAPPASRGIGVIRRERGAFTNEVDLEGVVMGAATEVEVEGVKAKLEPLDARQASQLGLTGPVKRFVARTTLPANRDTVRVVAKAAGGARVEAITAPRVDQRWAVVIGIGDYRSPAIPDLAFSGADAQAMYDFLRSEAAGPFPADHILFLKDGAATAQAMREALFLFLQKADWDDLVVVYFAGHGAPDPNRPDNLYLLPADADPQALAATGFPMWDIKTALRRQIKSERVIVIADACHSGGAQEGLQNPVGGSFTELFTPSRRLTLTAADLNELSFEDVRWGGGHGVFTHHLLQGLRGAADGDANGIVTFAEVANYVTTKVRGDTNGRQNPQRSGLGDVPLAVAASTARPAGE
ncbi:MAG: caspase family protein [Gemmatimonadetes bacterium]|nr:caspase family protein [Gemmatimonadota bacterium]